MLFPTIFFYALWASYMERLLEQTTIRHRD